MDLRDMRGIVGGGGLEGSAAAVLESLGLAGLGVACALPGARITDAAGRPLLAPSTLLAIGRA